MKKILKKVSPLFVALMLLSPFALVNATQGSVADGSTTTTNSGGYDTDQ